MMLRKIPKAFPADRDLTAHKDMPARRSATGGWLGRFWNDQAGAMSYIALTGSLIMMIFAGIGIDMMHAELRRNKVQHTLDRAVLAAANMNNTRDEELVVRDYFRAMDMEEMLDSVDPDASQGSRRVTAEGKSEVDSTFLSLLGIDALEVTGRATAENSVAPTEISLVLDISGSMSGRKLAQLKSAAKTFVDTVLGEGGNDSRVTISIIPYNATVNLGPELAARYAIEMNHNFSTCATFTDAQFDTTELDPDTPMGQIAPFDPSSGRDIFVDQPWCSTGTTGNIIAHSADKAMINGFIDGLVAQGNTAIDLGMKWGVALLDPTAKEVIADLADAGLSPEAAQYRPAAYESTTQKFVVVMTDGENTEQRDLKDYMKNPDNMSNVWVDDHGTPGTGDDRWSIRVIDNPGDHRDVFYWPHASGRTPRYNNGPYSWVMDGAAPLVDGVATIESDSGRSRRKLKCSTYQSAGGNSGQSTLLETITSIDYSELAGTSDGNLDCTNYAPVQLNWMELFSTVKVSEYANRWIWQAFIDGKASYQQYRDAYYAWEVKVDGRTADNRLDRICEAAKQKGMVVYSIGVEAPERGRRAMGSCASSPAHFYDVTGGQLIDAFSSISDMLVELRLTE
ncbi:Tad domain-containing protein [Sagittula salina]|uniref:VWA domain-containing protein n=1 Tax=Sagittula salina TaxID=2820268 RepID=A0A940RZV5_9RHOB|nr:Tad domain-containing protein [Sagittula salina]MBP0481397.1 VWA domain-containing protein [Sagittula salina]